MNDFFLPLFLVLIAITSTAVIRFRFDFMQPSVIVAAMMTLSTFFSLLMIEQWQLSMSINGFVLITSSVLAFVVGGMFAQRCLERPAMQIDTDFCYAIGNWKLRLTVIFMLTMVALNIQSIYELSILHGNQSGYSNMLATLRPLIERNELVFDRWISYRNQIAQMIACVFWYFFAFNMIFARVNQPKLLLPVLCYIPFPILTTARLAMFFFAAYLITVSVFLYQKKHQFTLKSKLNALKYLLGSGAIFIAVFFLIGMLMGKTVSTERTPFIILAHYVGLSIPALDVLTHQTVIETTGVGAHSLHGVYRVLQKFDEDLPTVPLFDPFVRFVGIDTNVYTALGHYFLDFGYLGTILIMWILGASYTLFYLFVKRREKNFALPLILYGVFCYPLFLSSISERVFFDFLSTTPIYAIILLLICKKIFFREVKCRCSND